MSEGADAPRKKGFPREVRITSGDQIRDLFRRGKRRKTRHFDVFVSTSPGLRSRVGLVVAKPRQKTSPAGKRIRAAAVQRNLLKRRLREIARVEILPRLDADGVTVDVLLRARPEAYGVEFAEMRSELLEQYDWISSNVA